MFRKMRVLLWSALIVSLSSLFLTVQAGSEDNRIEITTVIYMNGVPCSGLWTGSADENGEPDGDGVFESRLEGEEAFTVSGNWKHGALQGEVQIHLTDESVITVKFKNEVAQGDATRTFEDGSYQKYSYSKGIPSGRVVSFDSSGKIVALDRYYEGRLISEWCGEAEEINYRELLRSPDVHYDKMMKFEGIVTDILDDDESVYVIVRNEEGRSAIGTYGNTTVAAQQALVPTISVDDKVTLYGKFEKNDILKIKYLLEKITPLELREGEFQLKEYMQDWNQDEETFPKIENEQIYSTLPYIRVLAAEIEGSEKFPLNVLNYKDAKQYDYKLLVDYPYHMGTFFLENTATVVYCKYQYEYNNIVMILQKEDSNEIYYAVMDDKENVELPVIGDTITFKAKMNGNYKLRKAQNEDVSGKEVYLAVPRLKITELLSSF